MAAPTGEHVFQQKRRENVELSFAQRLAGNEKKTRDRAIKKLNQWIEARSKKSGAFPEEDLMKLWKGLFYCMWMSDKPLIQEELASKIADLTHRFTNGQAALGFFDACLQTIKREWAGIDFFRIDKFMMMVRKCLAQALIILKQSDWDESLVDTFLQVLIKTPLNLDPWACPDGLRIHISDIYREELGKIGADQLSKEQVNKLVDPFCVLVTTTKSKSLSQVMLQEFFGEIVTQSEVGMEGGSDSEDEGIQSGGDVEQEEVTLKDDKKKQKRKMKDVAEEEKDEEEKEEEEGEEQEEFIDKWEEHLAEIPQLQFDYSAIADRLLELAGSKDTLHNVRRNVYVMVQKLRDLSVGFYPMPDLEELQEEVEKEEKQVERELDPELKEKIHLKNKAKKRRKRKKKTSESEGDSAGGVKDSDEEDDDDEDVMPVKQKRKKLDGAVTKDDVETRQEGDETTEKPRKKRKRRKKHNQQDQEVSGQSHVDDGPGPAKIAKLKDADTVKGKVKGRKSKGKSQKTDVIQDTSKIESQSPGRSLTKTKESPDLQGKKSPKTPTKDIIQADNSTIVTSTPKSLKKAKLKSDKEGSIPPSSEETSGQEEIKTLSGSAKKNKRRKSRRLSETEDGIKDTPSSDARVDQNAAEKVLTPVEKAQPKSAKKERRKSLDSEDSTPSSDTGVAQSPAKTASPEEKAPRSTKKKGRKSLAAEDSTPNIPSNDTGVAQSPAKTASPEEKATPKSTKKKGRESIAAEDSTPNIPSSDTGVAQSPAKTASPEEKATPKSTKKKGRKSIAAEDSTSNIPSSDASPKKATTPSPGKKSQPKSAKKKGRKSKVAFEAETSTPKDNAGKVADKKATPIEKEVTPISKRTRRKSSIIQAKLKEAGGDVTPVVARRSKRLSESEDGEKEITNVKPATPASAKKKVKIALSQNEVRAAKDYRIRIQSSPGIPFDSSKKPSQPALKFTPPTTRARSKAMSSKKKR